MAAVWEACICTAETAGEFVVAGLVVGDGAPLAAPSSEATRILRDRSVDSATFLASGEAAFAWTGVSTATAVFGERTIEPRGAAADFAAARSMRPTLTPETGVFEAASETAARAGRDDAVLTTTAAAFETGDAATTAGFVKDVFTVAFADWTAGGAALAAEGLTAVLAETCSAADVFAPEAFVTCGLPTLALEAAAFTVALEAFVFTAVVLTAVVLEAAVLAAACFVAVALAAEAFADAVLPEAYFTAGALEAAALAAADFADAVFAGPAFEDAPLDETALDETSLAEALFADPLLADALLEAAPLEDTLLDDALLEATVLATTVLASAVLGEAVFTDAAFPAADFALAADLAAGFFDDILRHSSLVPGWTPGRGPEG